MTTQHADRLPRYKQLRQVGLAVNNRLVKTLTKADLDTGGKRLGLLRKGTLVFDTEDEMSVLMDYCLHDIRRDGVTAIERFLAESPPAPDSDELVYLEALCRARYSLFVVEVAERGVGIHVQDLLRDEPKFLTDVGLSQSGVAGMVLATRVIAPEGIDMTTGAGLPVGTLLTAQRTAVVDGLRSRFPGVDFRHLTPDQGSELATFVIRGSLERGAAERIAYRDAGQADPVEPSPSTLPPGSPAGRNDPCPCGSGKKYKRCCGA